MGKILFIYPNLMRQEYLSLGIGYLSSYLKEYGHKAELMDYTFGGSINDCIRKTEQTNPDMIGFSLRSGELSFSLRIAEKLKEEFDIPILFGGVHPTVAPEETIMQDNVDMICIGEGELALLELLDKIENKVDCKIRNFWFKSGNKIIRNPVRPLIPDLDTIPFPDRELFDFEKYLKVRGGAVDILATRGCPFDCSYCINHVFHKLYKGENPVRTRSVGNILDEISLLASEYDVTCLNFQDDTFTVNRNWVREFSRKYSKEFAIPFTCNARAETLTREICDLLKNAGCMSLHIGVESGSEQLRRKVLKRGLTNRQLVDAFENAKNAGLNTYSFNMVGVPFERRKDMLATIELNRRIRPDFLQVSIFQPYPGTELYDLCKEKGWIRDMELSISHQLSSIMSYPHVSSEEIEEWKRLFRFRVLCRSNLRKALGALFLDMNYDVFTRLRSRIPPRIKQILFRINQSFMS